MADNRIIVGRFQAPEFKTNIFSPKWNEFVEYWAPKCYAFVLEALGPYGTEPLPNIIAMSDAMHAAGANASFNMATGQITLHPYMEGKPGTTLEKLTHELVHGSFGCMPDHNGDPFYDESIVDYSVYVMSKSNFWGPYRKDMIEAADFNLKMRAERALSTRTDYDRKRWAGAICAKALYGEHILTTFKMKKSVGDYTW